MIAVGREGVEVDSAYAWHLAEVERAQTLRKPAGRPQPVWFHPF